MKFDPKRLAPMGFPVHQEIHLFFGLLGASGSYSFMCFLFRFLGARNELYDYDFFGKRFLIEGACMPDLSNLLRHNFIGFFILLLFAIGACIYHYLFHSQGSKSIYLMKRLPKRQELYFRCFTLPLIGSFICIASIILLWFLYLGIYILFTPNGCLPAHYL